MVATYEVFVCVVDAVPMLAVAVGFLVLHPTRLVREVARSEGGVKAEGESSLLYSGEGRSGW
jgi:hypothetical protein